MDTKDHTHFKHFFFGSLREDTQDVILRKAKSEHFNKEVPHALAMNQDIGDTNDQLIGSNLESQEEKKVIIHDIAMEKDNQG